MKYLLITLLLIGIVDGCFGQQSEPIEKAIFFGNKLETDTVKCIILYIDTAFVEVDCSEELGFKMDSTVGVTCLVRDTNVHWMNGYVIDYSKDVGRLNIPVIGIIYLDENKQPLPSSYIVWMAK